MSDIILIPIVALVGFAAGAFWMYRLANDAIDEYYDAGGYVNGKAPPPSPDRD